jgi:hypothetical protein
MSLLACCSVFKRFSQLNAEAVGKDKNAKLKRDDILELPELKVMMAFYGLCSKLLNNDWLGLSEQKEGFPI